MMLELAAQARQRHSGRWRYFHRFHEPSYHKLTCEQGVGGLTKRDISLVTDAGLYTVEAVAYT
jgi:hypothetical protein